MIKNSLLNPLIEPSYSITKILKLVSAIFIWVYIFIKLFLFDFEIYIMNRFFPEQISILNYKFFIIIGIIGFIWLFTKNKKFLLFLSYIIFFPLIVFFWILPSFIYRKKNWVLVIAFINSLIYFFVSLKYNFIVSVLYLISLLSIFKLSNNYLWVSIVIIFVILLLTYLQCVISIFKPSEFYQFYLKLIARMRKHQNGFKAYKLDDSIKDLSVEKMGKEQLQKWSNNLQTSLLMNRIFLFTAKKLREYQTSKLNVAFYIITILLILLLTVLTFTFINYAIFNMNNEFFVYNAIPTFFTFFYYSFNVILFNSIPEIQPSMLISQSIFMLESFFSLFLVGILISLLFSIKSEKQTEYLNQVIKGFEDYGNDLGDFILEEYKIKSIEEAMNELRKIQVLFVKILYRLTENIND